ncbi:putative bifunctional diguanylate cyclase/phosphodiesterase [Sandarakinorhabdus sp. DWP1-3-1]|uniref:putative bifunctional diguanylate cyclase/phosphodiesterase n=1 Tax=Sandarakinorhabdus sp. DWP1-3-1 TaxID=2804627 RepID=UPI003CEAA1C0
MAATSWAVVITDATQPDNPVAYVNEAFSILTGYRPDEIIGRNCRFLQGAGTDRQVRMELGTAIASGGAVRREILNYRKDGTPFWNDLTIDPIRTPDGRLAGFIGIQRQADETRRALQDKLEAESRLARIASNISGYIYQRIMRVDGTIEVAYVSPSLRTLLGIADDVESPDFYGFVHPDDRPALLAAIRSSAARMAIFREEFRLITSGGSVRWLRSEAPPRRLENGDVVWDGLAIEIAAEARWESEIASQALSDPLTGLLTRAAMGQALAPALEAAALEGRKCGLLYIDLAEFHALNDRHGQAFGDEALRQIAQRLKTMASGAGGIAARLGGDEFTVLAPACGSEAALLLLAGAVADNMASPMAVAGLQVSVRCCIGGALSAGSEQIARAGDGLASELLSQAEKALRWAKQAGPGAHMLYSPDRDDELRNQGILARSLAQAVADEELDLHYQPLVDLSSGRIVSAEALVRWDHPTLGMQMPDAFIPLAEKQGMIAAIGRWVIKRAFRQSRQWRDAGLCPPPIAINISGIQLTEPGFVTEVSQALQATGNEARDFELELTEGVLIEPSQQVLTSLKALRAMGFALVIDDFGSGHASFRYLRDFPVDKLKIDQTFVRKLVVNSTDALIIKAVISLARSMDIAFVAEGIETEMQRDFLEQEGCSTGQGYLFSMPLIAEEFGRMLAHDVRLPRHATRPPPSAHARHRALPPVQGLP